MAKKKNKTNFLVQGSILAASSIIVRLIGMFYRIPLTSIIGDKGNGIYSVAYEVYTILLLISSYSLPLAVSKLVSRYFAKGQKKNAYRYFRCSMLFAIVVGLAVAIFTYVFAGFISGTLMSSPMSALSLKVLAPTIFIVAVMGVLRGYFQGIGNMVPTAISQIVEQIVNAVVSVAAAYMLFSYGKSVSAIIEVDGYDAAYGAMGATMGTLFGALAGLIVMILLMFLYLALFRTSIKKDKNKTIDPMRVVYSNLIITIIPVILSTAAYNFSSVIDQGVFNKLMALQGYTHDEYNSLWGIYSGKYRLLTNVPISIASALASSTVITIQSAVARKQQKEIVLRTRLCIRFVMIVTIPCAVGLTVLASPILQLLWSDSRAISANLLRVGSISVVLYALSTLSNGILQGIDRMRIPVINALISLVLQVGLLALMIVAFKWNVYAVVYANIFFALLMCILNGIAMRRHIKGYRQEVWRTFVIPGICSVIMGAAVFGVYKLVMMLLKSNAAGTILSICVGVIVYFVAMMITGGIREQELKAMPKGHVIIRIGRALHLI